MEKLFNSPAARHMNLQRQTTRWADVAAVAELAVWPNCNHGKYLDIFGRRCTLQLSSWLLLYQCYDIIHWHSEYFLSQPHILYQECSENKYVWGCDDQLLEMFNPPPLFWPSWNILLLNLSASLKWNSVPRVWRLLNKEQLQNCQCLLLPPR